MAMRVNDSGRGLVHVFYVLKNSKKSKKM